MIRIIKFFVIRLIERNTHLHLLIYNNISRFKFLFPHEKDYFGLKKIFLNQNKVGAFLDIGGNIGLSTIGFRVLGFKRNKILIFEPNKILYSKFLINIKKNYKKVFIFNFALSNKRDIGKLYIPFYKNKYFHFWSSLDLKYAKKKVIEHYPSIHKKFKYPYYQYKLEKLDNLKIKLKTSFVKIDVEGHDYEVLLGMKKFIKKNLPVILVEYNRNNFNKILLLLKKNYQPFIFKNIIKKFEFLNKKKIRLIQNNSFFKNNFAKERNIFFIPQKIIKDGDLPICD